MKARSVAPWKSEAKLIALQYLVLPLLSSLAEYTRTSDTLRIGNLQRRILFSIKSFFITKFQTSINCLLKLFFLMSGAP